MDQVDKLRKLSERLIEHADSITNVAAHELENDLRTAAKILEHVANDQPQLGSLIE